MVAPRINNETRQPERTLTTKTILLQTAAVLALSTFPALAGPFGLPDHEKDGWRDTGCDEAFNVEIKNDEGKVLYLNNPTCPEPQGPSAEEASAGPGEGPGDGDDGEGPGDGDDGEGPGDGDDGEGPGEGPGDDGHGNDDGDGDNGHGNDDDGDDDSNPGQGGGKPGKPGKGKPIKLA